MARFVVYKNSILATICSMVGAVCVVMAVSGLIGKEIGILPAIIMIAVGLGLMFLAGYISERKEKKKKAKAAAKAAAAQTSASGSNTGYTRPVQTVRMQQTAHTAGSAGTVSVNKSIVFASILFLLAGALGIWGCKSLSIIPTWNNTLNSEQIMLAAMSFVLAIAAFRTRHIQEVSILFVFGYLGLTLGSVDVALSTYRDFGFGGYSSSVSIHYMLIFASLVSAASYFLMTVFALFSLRRIKNHLGGIVKWLWFIPVLALAAAFVKWYDDNYIANAFTKVFYPGWIGLKKLPREFLEAIARSILILATFFSGLCFRRLCKKTETVSRQEPHAQPEPEYTAPVQPQSESRYTAPEPHRPASDSQTENPEIEKLLLAYKDLLDCGILSQKEYDQKVRELMENQHGGTTNE